MRSIAPKNKTFVKIAMRRTPVIPRVPERFPIQNWKNPIHPTKAKCDEEISTDDKVALTNLFYIRFNKKQRRSRKGHRPHKFTADSAFLKAVEIVVAPMRKEIAELRAAIKDPIAPEPDEFEKWIQSDDAKKYAGEFVAMTEPGKVIAHSPNNDELMRLIVDCPNKSGLVVDLVPRA